jgi:hypothetical protein
MSTLAPRDAKFFATDCSSVPVLLSKADCRAMNAMKELRFSARRLNSRLT